MNNIYCGYPTYPSNPPPVYPPVNPPTPPAPPVVPTPCDSITRITSDSTFMEYMQRLKAAENSGTEWSYYSYLGNDSIPSYFGKQGEPGKPEIAIPYLAPNIKLNGYMHLHYRADSLLSVYSASDLFILYNWYNNGNMESVKWFLYPLVTGKGSNYILRIADEAKFRAFGQIWMKELNDAYVNILEKAYYPKITAQKTNAENELEFLKLAGQMGVELYRGNDDFTRFERVKLNATQTQVVANPC